MTRRETIRRRQLAYQRCFFAPNGRLHPDAVIVLNDLRRLSKKSAGGLVISAVSGMVDVHATLHANGRREVYDRILAMLELDQFDNLPQEELPNEPTSNTAIT